MSKFVVNPWEVSGNIDYDKLMEDFGIKELNKLPKQFKEMPLFRRNIIFAHRDFEQITNAINKKEDFAMMTGLMPSGKFHFGHKLVADQIIFYQSLGAKIYIAVADLEAYGSRNKEMKELSKIAIEEYLTNYIALGLKPKKCDFYFQSKRSKDGKKSNAYYSLANMLSRHATFNEFKSVYGEITPSKINASVLQASDMLHPQIKEFNKNKIPTIIPVGCDQDPHIRLARDVSQRIKEYNFLKISSTYHKFLPGLKGGKMSSSDSTSYIALTDTIEEAEEKIKKHAFSGGRNSLKEHREKGGNTEIDVSYQLLRYGLETDDKKLNKIKKEYESGNMLTGELKQITIEKITEFLKKHQKNREKASKKIEKFIF